MVLPAAAATPAAPAAGAVTQVLRSAVTLPFPIRKRRPWIVCSSSLWVVLDGVESKARANEWVRFDQHRHGYESVLDSYFSESEFY